MRILRTWFSGAWRALRAPVLLLVLYLLTVAVAAPLGMWLQRSLPAPAILDVVDAKDPPAPDVDWLDEVSLHAPGLARFLSPAVIGVAAPVGNLDALLDGSRPPLPLLAPIAVFFLCWTAVWGGVITRLARGSRVGVRAAIAASRQAVVPLLALGIAGGIAYLVLYLTLHATMFGPLYDWLIAGALERTAFLWRVALVAIFGGLLLTLGQVFDFARVSIILGRASVPQALSDSVTLVGQQWGTIVVLLLFNGLGLAVLFAGYAASEFIPGGSVPSLWRLVAGGQALILGRLLLRLVLAGAQADLYLRVRGERVTT
jgi:hypothetical protein